MITGINAGKGFLRTACLLIQTLQESRTRREVLPLTSSVSSHPRQTPRFEHFRRQGALLSVRTKALHLFPGGRSSAAGSRSRQPRSPSGDVFRKGRPDVGSVTVQIALQPAFQPRGLTPAAASAAASQGSGPPGLGEHLPRARHNADHRPALPPRSRGADTTVRTMQGENGRESFKVIHQVAESPVLPAGAVPGPPACRSLPAPVRPGEPAPPDF
ncbi:uncharacterized protein AAES06_011905 isoform 1-T1 [Glossophaga mutica]